MVVLLGGCDKPWVRTVGTCQPVTVSWSLLVSYLWLAVTATIRDVPLQNYVAANAFAHTEDRFPGAVVHFVAATLFVLLHEREVVLKRQSQLCNDGIVPRLCGCKTCSKFATCGVRTSFAVLQLQKKKCVPATTDCL